MPIPLPNLDDRTFSDLVTEGRAMIPRLAPRWTNYNPSDPGITLTELLAWLAEMALYRLNQVPEENYRTFLGLLGVDLTDRTTEAGIREAVESLGRLTRGVGPADFVRLAQDVRLSDGTPAVARAVALADQNLEGTTSAGEAHVSLVVLPPPAVLGLGATPAAERGCAVLTPALAGPEMAAVRTQVNDALRPNRLLTTELHVVAPSLVSVKIDARVVAEPDVDPASVASETAGQVRVFLDPWEGGVDGRGWPFGRALYRSELLQRLERVAGVDHVDSLLLEGDDSDTPVALQGHQLFCVSAVSVTAASGTTS